eukprot:m.342995 g.342995  ORF g.342995 m.342995 type:complete len:292 (+) comp22178_c0_seq1:58-933(+)
MLQLGYSCILIIAYAIVCQGDIDANNIINNINSSKGGNSEDVLSLMQNNDLPGNVIVSLLRVTLKRIDGLSSEVETLRVQMEALNTRLSRQENSHSTLSKNFWNLKKKHPSDSEYTAVQLEKLRVELQAFKRLEKEEDIADEKEHQKQIQMERLIKKLDEDMKLDEEEDETRDLERLVYWAARGGGILVVLGLLLYRQIYQSESEEFGETRLDTPIERNRRPSSFEGIDLDNYEPSILTPRKPSQSSASTPRQKSSMRQTVYNTLVAQRWLRKVRSKGTQGFDPNQTRSIR